MPIHVTYDGGFYFPSIPKGWVRRINTLTLNNEVNMRDLREIAAWLIASDFLMIAGAIIFSIAHTTSEPLATALFVNAMICGLASIVSLAVACLGITVVALRWRKSK
jgi:hypothetical protein